MRIRFEERKEEKRETRYPTAAIKNPSTLSTTRARIAATAVGLMRINTAPIPQMSKAKRKKKKVMQVNSPLKETAFTAVLIYTVRVKIGSIFIIIIVHLFFFCCRVCSFPLFI